MYRAYACHIYSRWAIKLKCADMSKHIYMVIVNLCIQDT